MISAGQVSVFNCFSEPLSLSVNGPSVGQIDAWNTGPGGLLFEPAGMAITRTIDPGQGGTFFNGTNQIIVDWMGEIFHVDVAVDGAQHPLRESLALMILRTSYSLLNAFGVVIVAGPLVEGPALKTISPAPSTPPPPSDPRKQE